MKRRHFIQTGAAACTAALVTASCATSPPVTSLGPVVALVREVFNCLDEATRNKACVPYDHPLRQYHNRGVGTGGLPITRDHFNRDQIKLLNSLFYSGLSEAGRQIVPRQYFLRFGGVKALRFLLAGDPHGSHFQVILSGPHLNLRLGGVNREGVAFGGPQVYGDQRGDGRLGLPNNIYRPQLQLGHALFQSLNPHQRDRALLPAAPIQTQIELQGEQGRFAGVAVKALADRGKLHTHDLIQAILAPYPDQDRRYAWECLQHNGGIDSLYLSYYENGQVGESGPYQIFRLEGPAAVFYFRGHPHVHAFINLAWDGNRPLSVGEELGENATPLEGTAVKALFERAMKTELQTDWAYYDLASVVGRLRAGIIRSGDIYNLESWGNSVAIVSIRGAKIGKSIRQALSQTGRPVEAEKVYTIATPKHLVDEHFGRGRAVPQKILLRDLTIGFLKKSGFG